MKLGESFPHATKLDSVRRQFTAGLVVTLFLDFINDPKLKWLLIVSARCDRPLFFIINTDLTAYTKQTPRLIDQQLRILKATDPCMTHDSWIDCSTVYNHFELSEIEDALVNHPEFICGNICRDTALAVLEKVTESEILERRHINQISAELSELV